MAMTFSSDHKLEFSKELAACAVINDARDPRWNITVKSLTNGAVGGDDVLDVAVGNSIARFVGTQTVSGSIVIVRRLQRPT